MSVIQSFDSLGADLRALRKSRGLTLTDVAAAVGRSVGWMSQVERDMSQPSMPELKQLADVLGVSVSTFFGQAPARPGEEGIIVRRHARRPIGHRVHGLTEELLSPDLTDDFEVIHSVFEANTERKTLVQRDTQEVGYIITGKLELIINGTAHTLTAGDSFRLRGEPFRWANKTDTPCIAIWIIAPPVY